MDAVDPSLVEMIFQEFRDRRAGIIEALTTDLWEFFNQCVSDEENLCLFGYEDGTWEVKLLGERVPLDIPEPVVGINFAIYHMPIQDWLLYVAAHSDSWLLSVAFYGAARLGFGKSERALLFSMINDLPTIWEIIR